MVLLLQSHLAVQVTQKPPLALEVLEGPLVLGNPWGLVHPLFLSLLFYQVDP